MADLRQPDLDAEKKTKNELRDLRSRDPQEFLTRVFEMDQGRPFCGFKIFVKQNDAILDQLLIDPSVRKVILFRTNLLANYASARAARGTGSWKQNADNSDPAQKLVRFDEADFLKCSDKYVGFYRRVIAELTRAREPFHMITYDAINDPMMFAGVINFIGADPNKPLNFDDQPRMQVKQGSPDILSRFANPKHVREYLVSHSLLHWCFEGETSLEFMSGGPGAGEDDEED